MSPLVVNRKLTSKYDVYVGRPTKWGNPFREGQDGTRRQVITKYAAYLLERPVLCLELAELRDKTLGCWCRPKECHADVLIAAAQSCTLGWEVRSGWQPHWWYWWCRVSATRWMQVYSNGEWLSSVDSTTCHSSPGSVELAKYLAVEEWVSRCVFGDL